LRRWKRAAEEQDVSGGEAIIEREAVRAILLTPAREVLLMRIRAPGADQSWWITPGGGVAGGESDEQALRRELREELGFDGFALGPLVWRRQHTFNWLGRRLRQRERYFVVHAGHFEPRMTDPVERQVLQEFRWWSLREMQEAREPLTPLSLADIVARYLQHGPPGENLSLEVRED
jgi:8-oxo-dGTP pyrophosphatase MutT (NUDIX family)